MVKNPPANAGDTRDLGSIPGSGRSPGEGNGNPLQYSCLGNPMDRGAWWAAVHGSQESDTTVLLSMHALSSGKGKSSAQNFLSFIMDSLAEFSVRDEG